MIGEDDTGINHDATAVTDMPPEPDNDDLLEVGGFDCEELKFRWNNLIPVTEVWNDNLQRTVDELLHEPFTADISRRVVDMVVSRAALQKLTPQQRQYINQYLEAFVPIADSGNDELDDCYYIVFGNNAPDRRIDEDILHNEFDRVKALFDEEAQKPEDGNHPDTSGDGNIDIVEVNPDHPLWEQYVDCLEHVGYEEEDTDGEICFAAISDGNVVSSGIMLDDAIEVKRHDKPISIRLIEMTGAYTHPDFRRKGIYQRILRAEYAKLAQEEDPVHIVEGFTRNSEPALRAVARSGRMVFHPDTDIFGLAPRGLVNHSTGDDNETFITHYFNFLSGNQLRARFG